MSVVYVHIVIVGKLWILLLKLVGFLEFGFVFHYASGRIILIFSYLARASISISEVMGIRAVKIKVKDKWFVLVVVWHVLITERN